MVRQRHTPAEPGGWVPLRVDNEARVGWIQRYRGGKGARLRAIVRLSGVIFYWFGTFEGVAYVRGAEI